MAQITKNNGENSMAEEESDDRAESATETEKVEYRSAGGPLVAERSGFFHVYKSGQGYWTRMLTALGAALIILLIGHFLYTYLPTWSDTLSRKRGVMIGIVLAVMAGLSLVAFYFTNKATNVDFLIATDSEMKKVNWTSRAELIGSTKIVIIFVVLISAILFVIDIVFGYLFYFLKVLKQPPF